MSKSKKIIAPMSVEEIQQKHDQQYVGHLEKGWHTVRRILPTVREVEEALDGLQVLFEKLQDVPIQGSRLSGVGVLVGLVRERVEGVDGQLVETQRHWKDGTL